MNIFKRKSGNSHREPKGKERPKPVRVHKNSRNKKSIDPSINDNDYRLCFQSIICYHRLFYNHNIVSLCSEFNKILNSVKKVAARKGYYSWEKEIDKGIDRIVLLCNEKQILLKGEGLSLSILEEHIHELPYLKNFTSLDDVKDIDPQLDELFFKMNDSVKKGNRANFKMIQELEDKMHEVLARMDSRLQVMRFHN